MTNRLKKAACVGLISLIIWNSTGFPPLKSFSFSRYGLQGVKGLFLEIMNSYSPKRE